MASLDVARPLRLKVKLTTTMNIPEDLEEIIVKFLRPKHQLQSQLLTVYIVAIATALHHVPDLFWNGMCTCTSLLLVFQSVWCMEAEQAKDNPIIGKTNDASFLLEAITEESSPTKIDLETSSQSRNVVVFPEEMEDLNKDSSSNVSSNSSISWAANEKNTTKHSQQQQGPFRIYAQNHYDEESLESQIPKNSIIFATKTIHFQQVGQGYHDLLLQVCQDATAASLPLSSPNHPWKRSEIKDAPLTEQGFQQCRKQQTDSLNPELILVSPLQRALQTCSTTFDPYVTTIPWIACEGLRPSLGEFVCNQRRSKLAIQRDFPFVDLRLLQDDGHNDDPLWNPHQRETPTFVADRAYQFWIKDVASRPETQMVLVGHGSWWSIVCQEIFRNDIPLLESNICSVKVIFVKDSSEKNPNTNMDSNERNEPERSSILLKKPKPWQDDLFRNDDHFILENKDDDDDDDEENEAEDDDNNGDEENEAEEDGDDEEENEGGNEEKIENKASNSISQKDNANTIRAGNGENHLPKPNILSFNVFDPPTSEKDFSLGETEGLHNTSSSSSSSFSSMQEIMGNNDLDSYGFSVEGEEAINPDDVIFQDDKALKKGPNNENIHHIFDAESNTLATGEPWTLKRQENIDNIQQCVSNDQHSYIAAPTIRNKLQDFDSESNLSEDDIAGEENNDSMYSMREYQHPYLSSTMIQDKYEKCHSECDSVETNGFGTQQGDGNRRQKEDESTKEKVPVASVERRSLISSETTPHEKKREMPIRTMESVHSLSQQILQQSNTSADNARATPTTVGDSTREIESRMVESFHSVTQHILEQSTITPDSVRKSSSTPRDRKREIETQRESFHSILRKLDYGGPEESSETTSSEVIAANELPEASLGHKARISNGDERKLTSTPSSAERRHGLEARKQAIEARLGALRSKRQGREET